MRSLFEMRSACANNAALEDEERWYGAQTDRWPGWVVRNEKTRFHWEEFGPRSVARETFHVWPACSSTRQAIGSEALQHAHGVTPARVHQLRTSAWNRARRSRVTGPALPLPMIRPSSWRMATSSLAVPVKNASSAVYTS
jgi:hypothetical protein